MGVPVKLSGLAGRIEEFGDVAYVITVNEHGVPHVVSARIRWDGDKLVTAAGTRTLANVGHSQGVSLLWPAPPGTGYSLIVDGEAAAMDGPEDMMLSIAPLAAVLHRTPEGDPASPSCIKVLPAV